MNTSGSVKLICEWCKEPFLTFPSRAAKGKKFCSNKCRGRALRTGSQFDCAYCGTEFYVRPAYIAQGAKYCSRECYREDNQKREMVIVCEWCGRKARPDDTHYHRDHKYCSKKCTMAAINAARRKNSPVIVCAYCGNESRRSRTYLFKLLPFKNEEGLFAWKRSESTHNRMFCNCRCYSEYLRLHPEEHPGAKALLGDPLRRSILFVKASLANSMPKVYTPEFLRMMLEWKDPTCSRPGCDRVLSKHNKSPWHACWYHNQLVKSALTGLDKRRRAALTNFGFEPI